MPRRLEWEDVQVIVMSMTVNMIVAVAVVSDAFTTAEGKWKTIEQEAFRVVWMVLSHRNILWGHPFLLETYHRNLLFIHGGTSAKVTRWSLTVQNVLYTLAHAEWEAPNMRDFYPSLSESSFRFGSIRVVAEGVDRREIFDRRHNSMQGHHDIHVP